MRRRRDIRRFFITAGVAMSLLVSASAQAQKSPASTIIGTNPAGSLFYSVASGLAKVISGAGTVQAVGEGVSSDALGSRVCALVSGGGYAQFCLAPAGQCLPVPEALSAVEAAAIPETVFTVFTARW